MLVSQPDSGEQALEIAEALARSGAIDCIVIDSVAAMVTKSEIDGEMGDTHVGQLARLMSQAMRKLTSVIAKSNTTAIFINQVREKIGVMYGNPETTPGGRALKFYASVRIEVRRGEQIKNGSEVIGNRTKCKVVKNKVGVYVKYGSNTLSTAYDDEKNRTVNAAVGQEEYIFTTGYSDAVYDDEDVLAALATQPEVVCNVNKDAVVGDEFPVSVQLPEKVSFDNFELVSIVPDVAKLVMAESPGITVTVPETVTYGDEFTLVTNEHGITYNSTVLTSGVVSMTYKGVVTAKKAGKAELVVTTTPKTVDGVDYGATTTRVAFDIQKAALTIKASDVEVNLDGDLPETYELVYEGLVNKDKAETVFTDMPVATVNLPEPLTAGTYPIKVSVSEEPENYVVTTVDGTLTVKDGSSVAGVSSKNDKVTYANGNLYVPCGGRVEIYALTGTLVGRYEGAVIPVALRTNTLYIVKTQKGAFRLWVK